MFFFSPRSLSGALRRTTQYWAKLPKAKEKHAARDGKTRKGTEEQDNQSTYSFQNYNIRTDCSCFCIKAGTWIKKRKPHFQQRVWQILVRRGLLCSKSERQHGRIFLLSLTECYSFFLLWAYFPFYQGLPSAFYFSMSKDFSINKELPRVNFVKCAM